MNVELEWPFSEMLGHIHLYIGQKWLKGLIQWFAYDSCALCACYRPPYRLTLLSSTERFVIRLMTDARLNDTGIYCYIIPPSTLSLFDY